MEACGLSRMSAGTAPLVGQGIWLTSESLTSIEFGGPRYE